MKYSNEKIVYQGKLFNISQKEVIDDHGHKHIIETCSRPDVVTVMGVNEAKEVMLLKEFRPGANGYVYWLPGGRIDAGENPELAAQREFEEETQYIASQYELFHSKYPSDSFSSSGYVFLAKGLTEGSNRKGDESGDISIVPTSIDDAIQMTLIGEIPNEFFCFLLVKLRQLLKG